VSQTGWHFITDGHPRVTVLERASKGNMLYLRTYDPNAQAGKRR
jgi:hypothetical protein